MHRPQWTVKASREEPVARGRLNATAAALLGLLEDCGELTGADLVRVADLRIGGYWSVTRSQVYRELRALADAGLVDAGPPGARDAQPFAITPDGRARLRVWLREEEPRDAVRIGLLLLVAFGRHLPPGRLREVLDDYEARHRERRAHYEALDAELAERGEDPFVRATLSFGLHYERAVLDWLAALPPEVRGRAGAGEVG
jgi:DNA-binding PadR family transcriptional regulator